METYQKDFIELALSYSALRFGEFTLKSGRMSPYFFNAGVFCTGEALNVIAHAYAKAISHAKLEFDVLFGPAYKGIPLACATSMALSDENRPIPFAYNRKEAKDHGEGGLIVGAPLNQRVVIVDDVITAGTAIRESIDLIQQAGGTLTGIVVALDRQEKGQGSLSAIQEIASTYHVNVVPIIRFDDILEFAKQSPQFEKHTAALAEYRQTYGIEH